jgi:hypothetical protein
MLPLRPRNRDLGPTQSVRPDPPLPPSLTRVPLAMTVYTATQNSHSPAALSNSRNFASSEIISSDRNHQFSRSNAIGQDRFEVVNCSTTSLTLARTALSRRSPGMVRSVETAGVSLPREFEYELAVARRVRPARRRNSDALARRRAAHSGVRRRTRRYRLQRRQEYCLPLDNEEIASP